MSKYFNERQTQIEAYKEAGYPVYQHKYNRTMEHTQFIQTYEHLVNEEVLTCVESIAGQIMSMREYGNLIFYDIMSDQHSIQIMVNKKIYNNNPHFKMIKKTFRVGDWIGATGNPTRTKTGELSLIPTQLDLLSVCYHMIQTREQFALSDPDTRIKKRYLDLKNKKSYDVFITRSKTISFIRRYYEDQGYIEVETPVLASKAGGATARPFTTHHNELDQNMFMRIAPELYLKTLVVGGMEKVYEIGKQFRNEGIDQTHNPEFTTIESYGAFLDYYDLMDMVEILFRNLVYHIHGTHEISYPSGNGDEMVVLNFSMPFRRIRMMDELANKIGFEYPDNFDYDSDEANTFFLDLCNNNDIVCPPPTTTPRLIDRLVGEYVEVDCNQPTFIMDHPMCMSPLAKYHREDARFAERFELFIMGKEMANAFTELNIPEIQKQMFHDQQKQKSDGDDEIPDADEDYIECLEHGLPPTGGIGIGIDRLVMILTGQICIRDVILFPARSNITETEVIEPEITEANVEHQVVVSV